MKIATHYCDYHCVFGTSQAKVWLYLFTEEGDFDSITNVPTTYIFYDVTWEIAVINDRLALEFDDTLNVVFVPTATGSSLITDVESLDPPTFIRSTATVTIMDNDCKCYIYNYYCCYG